MFLREEGESPPIARNSLLHAISEQFVEGIILGEKKNFLSHQNKLFSLWNRSYLCDPCQPLMLLLALFSGREEKESQTYSDVCQT